MSSHSIFQTSQIMPLNSHSPDRKTLKNPASALLSSPFRNFRKIRSIKASSGLVEADTRDFLERCISASPVPKAGSASSSSARLAPAMKGQYGAYGAVTLEKSKLDMSQRTTRSSPEKQQRRRTRTPIIGIYLFWGRRTKTRIIGIYLFWEIDCYLGKNTDRPSPAHVDLGSNN